MTTPKETLNTVLENIKKNLDNVNKALVQASAAVSQLDPEAVTAAKLLLAKYVHPQGVAAIVNSMGQLEALNVTKTELEVLIAAVQLTLYGSPDEEIAAQLDANATGLTDTPLDVPANGGMVPSDPVDPLISELQGTVDAQSQAPQKMPDEE